MTGGQLVKMRFEDASSSARQGGDTRILLSPTSVGSTSGFMGALRLGPCEYLNEHYHPYSEKFLYAVSGCVQVRAGAAEVVLDADEAVMVPKGTLVEGGWERATLYLTGPESFSVPEATTILSTVLGRKITYQDVPPEPFRAQLVSRGMPEWMADGIVAQYHTVLRGGHVPDITYEVPNIAGRPARTFEQFVRDNATGLQKAPVQGQRVA